MSEANNIPPPDRSGPAPRPGGDGLPTVEGGLKQPGREDAVNPAPKVGDRGGDVPGGMAGEG